MTSISNSNRELTYDLALIVAVARNGVIGLNGDLPWRLKADLQRFKRLTMGHRMVMGRKTWDSIGRPLPGRDSFVLSRSDLELPDGVVQLGSFDEIKELASDGGGTVFCIGGAALYEALCPIANQLMLTQVEAEVEGDVHFPTLDWSQWRIIERDEIDADVDNEYATTYVHCLRQGSEGDDAPPPSDQLSKDE